MKASIVLTGTSLLLLAGCVSLPKSASSPPGCTATNTIMVDQAPGRLVATPECLDIPENTLVTVVFSSPAPARGDARIKSRGNGWLNKKNDGADPARIELRPPPGSGGGGGENRQPYKYEIEIENVGTLDPRIVVQ
jgi:hypothetical protein